MLKLKDVPEEHTSEVVRLAAEMQMRDEETQQQQKSRVSAAEEVGISPEYLEKAAQEVHARKVIEIEERRKRNRIIGGVAAAAAAAGSIWFFTRPPAPTTLNLTAPTAVTQRVSTGTQATVTQQNGVAEITVNRFVPNAEGEYYANIELTGPTSLAGYRNMSFTVQGEGLQNFRVDVENGTERWKSQNLPVPGSEQRVTLNLDALQKQEQVNGKWRNVRGGKPGDVQRITVKTGETINSPDASGTLRIKDVRFE
ncbi:MAG: hypothetical protein OHK0029_04200 [Armatimonadaceae bacterium]